MSLEEDDSHEEGESHVRIGVIHSQATEHQRLVADHPNLGGGKEGFPGRFQREPGLADIVISDFSLHNCETVSFC